MSALGQKWTCVRKDGPVYDWFAGRHLGITNSNNIVRRNRTLKAFKR